MEISRVNLVYFSPTGGTRKILENIAIGINIAGVECTDVTHMDVNSQALTHFTNELVIIGAPVYSGRIPVDAVQRFKQLNAQHTPAVLVVVYGNRAFDDALLELQDLTTELGFVPCAGAAFVAEHSFSSSLTPIAQGRPNADDEKKAQQFGRAVISKLAAMPKIDAKALRIPGNRPYRAGAAAKQVAPRTREEVCAGCGICTNLCPTGAIHLQNGKAVSQPELCTLCCACIKGCPTHARYWGDDVVATMAQKLHTTCADPKQPEFFGV